MNMTGLKVISLMPLAATTMADLPMDWGHAGVQMLLVAGIIALWRDQNRRTEKLERIIEENTASKIQAAEMLAHQSRILIEYKTVLAGCKSQGAQLSEAEWDHIHERREGERRHHVEDKS